MTFTSNTYRLRAAAAFMLLLAFSAARAQVDHEVIEDGYDESSATVQPYTVLDTGEIEELVGPIALYPDDLVSIILPASTYPVQIVQAARFLEDREGNPGLEPPDDWDDAVVALLNYPEVIEMMSDDLDWTWALGETFLNQQSQVLAAVAEFRDQAYAAGNLKSDEHQVVRRSERVIEIVPADPEVIYVPYYEPERVIVYQPYPVYHYHPYPRYSYYYPYPAHYGFSYGYFFGVSTAYRLHWVNHRLYTFNYGYRGHPYFGRSYHNRFYYRHRPFRSHRRIARSQGGYANIGDRGDRWRPRRGHGPRPKARASTRVNSGVAINRGHRNRVSQGNVNAGRAGADRTDRRRGQVGNGQRAFSDKNREQRRTVRRYRDQANAGAADTTRRAASDNRARRNSRASNNVALVNRNAPRTNARSVRPENQARTQRRNRIAASENARDLTSGTRARRGGDSALRTRNQKPSRVVTETRRQPQASRRGNVQPPRRQQSRQQAAPERRAVQRREAPAQARRTQERPQARQARPPRSEQKSTPARSKQRRSGGHRSEPRRR